MLDNGNKLEEGTRRTNPMGVDRLYCIGRDCPLVHYVCHKGISVKLKPV